jgi:hypothetical protein
VPGPRRAICSSLALLAVCGVVAVRAARSVPTDAIHHPRKIVPTGGGACALFDGKPMRCWGSARFGWREGVFERYAVVAPHADAVDIALPTDWRSPDSACVVNREGVLECGRTDSRMSHIDQKFRAFPPLRSAPNLRDVRAPVTCETTVCVLARADGASSESVWCHARQDVEGADLPVVDTDWVRVDLGDATTIALNGAELCGLQTSGRVRCGGIGRASHEIAAIADAVQLALGDDFGCARDRRGVVRCWGRNDVGQLGDRTTIAREDARPIALDGPASDLSALGRRACVVRDGAPLCWGMIREQASLPEVLALSPERFADIDGLRTVTIAGAATCGIRASDETAWCWGYDSGGALGDGSMLPGPGCHREGIGGTSPERERQGAPTPVRTGDAGDFSRARTPLAIAAAWLILAPLALALSACSASLRRASLARQHLRGVLSGAACVVALFVPVLVFRLSQAALAVYGDSCRGWGCELRADSMVRLALTSVGPIAAFAIAIVFFMRLRSLVEFAGDVRAFAQRGARWLICGAVPALFFTMFMHLRYALDYDCNEALTYLLRNRDVDVSALFVVRMWWTIAWIVLVMTFATRARRACNDPT